MFYAFEERRRVFRLAFVIKSFPKMFLEIQGFRKLKHPLSVLFFDMFEHFCSTGS